MGIIKNAPVKMSADRAAAVISNIDHHPKDMILEATAALLHHMRLQNMRITLLEQALEDTGKEMVRARIAACQMFNPDSEDPKNDLAQARTKIMQAQIARYQGHPGDDRTNS